MKRNYYFLISSLPELVQNEEQKEHPFPLFYSFCMEQLHSSDLHKLHCCFVFNDFMNLLNETKDKEDFLTPSIYSFEEFNEAKKDPDLLYPFMADSLREGNLTMENLLEGLFEDLSLLPEGFVQDYLLFELHLRNITTACSHRHLKHEYGDFIIQSDDFSKQIAAGSGPDFGLGGEGEIFSTLLSAYGRKEPVEIELLIDQIRWEFLDEQVDYHLFSPEAVFSYAIKLSSIERWLKLKPETGKKLLEELVNSTRDQVNSKKNDTRTEAK